MWGVDDNGWRVFSTRFPTSRPPPRTTHTHPSIRFLLRHRETDSSCSRSHLPARAAPRRPPPGTAAARGTPPPVNGAVWCMDGVVVVVVVREGEMREEGWVGGHQLPIPAPRTQFSHPHTPNTQTKPPTTPNTHPHPHPHTPAVTVLSSTHTKHTDQTPHLDPPAREALHVLVQVHPPIAIAPAAASVEHLFMCGVGGRRRGFVFCGMRGRGVGDTREEARTRTSHPSRSHPTTQTHTHLAAQLLQQEVRHLLLPPPTAPHAAAHPLSSLVSVCVVWIGGLVGRAGQTDTA